MDSTLLILCILSLMTFMCLVLGMLAADRINSGNRDGASNMIAGLTTVASFAIAGLVLLTVGLFVTSTKESRSTGQTFRESYPLGLTANVALTAVFALTCGILTQVVASKNSLNNGDMFNAHNSMTTASILAGVAFGLTICSLGIYLKGKSCATTAEPQKSSDPKLDPILGAIQAELKKLSDLEKAQRLLQELKRLRGKSASPEILEQIREIEAALTGIIPSPGSSATYATVSPGSTPPISSVGPPATQVYDPPKYAPEQRPPPSSQGGRTSLGTWGAPLSRAPTGASSGRGRGRPPLSRAPTKGASSGRGGPPLVRLRTQVVPNAEWDESLPLFGGS